MRHLAAILFVIVLCCSAAPQELPLYVESMMEAQELHDGRKKRKELLPLARQAVVGLPSNSDAWAILAESEFLNGHWEKSITAYKKSLSLGPRVYRWRQYAQVGRAYAHLGQKDEAFRWLDLALGDRYQERDDFKTDRHLRNLHDEPRFNELAGIAPLQMTDRNERWRYDLNFYKREVLRLHPNPYFRVSKEEFDTAFDDIIDSAKAASI